MARHPTTLRAARANSKRPSGQGLRSGSWIWKARYRSSADLSASASSIRAPRILRRRPIFSKRRASSERGPRGASFGPPSAPSPSRRRPAKTAPKARSAAAALRQRNVSKLRLPPRRSAPAVAGSLRSGWPSARPLPLDQTRRERGGPPNQARARHISPTLLTQCGNSHAPKPTALFISPSVSCGHHAAGPAQSDMGFAFSWARTLSRARPQSSSYHVRMHHGLPMSSMFCGRNRAPKRAAFSRASPTSRGLRNSTRACCPASTRLLTSPAE